MYTKYSSKFITLKKLLFVSDQKYYLYLYCFQITSPALTPSKSTILCNVMILHVESSQEDLVHARLISPVNGVSITPCLPISFLCVTVTCST